MLTWKIYTYYIYDFCKLLTKFCIYVTNKLSKYMLFGQSHYNVNAVNTLSLYIYKSCEYCLQVVLYIAYVKCVLLLTSYDLFITYRLWYICLLC